MHKRMVHALFWFHYSKKGTHPRFLSRSTHTKKKNRITFYLPNKLATRVPEYAAFSAIRQSPIAAATVLVDRYRGPPTPACCKKFKFNNRKTTA